MLSKTRLLWGLKQNGSFILLYFLIYIKQMQIFIRGNLFYAAHQIEKNNRGVGKKWRKITVYTIPRRKQFSESKEASRNRI